MSQSREWPRVSRPRSADARRAALTRADAPVKSLAGAPLAEAPKFRQTPIMEVRLSPEQQAKLAHLAQERVTDAQALAREAIVRLLDYDAWFVREVEKGLAQV